jgi:hypothetical protein
MVLNNDDFCRMLAWEYLERLESMLLLAALLSEVSLCAALDNEVLGDAKVDRSISCVKCLTGGSWTENDIDPIRS